MPTIRLKFPGRSVAAKRTVQLPAGSGGSSNALTPLEKYPLVRNTVVPPRTTTIPTCAYFERRKRTANGVFGALCVVSSWSAGGVVKSAWKRCAVVQ